MGETITPPRLLLVSGNTDLQEVFADVLGEEGYDLRIASTLEEALALADQMAFALVLSELYAGISAHSFAPSHVLRRRVAPTPVALLTTETHLDGMDLSRFAFVQTMPFDLETLLGAIAAVLDRPVCPERARQVRVARQYFAALETEDWPALLALCTEDVVYYPPHASRMTTSRRLVGKDALRDYSARAATHYRSVSFRDLRLYDVPKGLAARYTGYWVTPEDRRHQASHTMFFRFEGELIARVGVSVHLEAAPVINGALGDSQAG